MLFSYCLHFSPSIKQVVEQDFCSWLFTTIGKFNLRLLLSRMILNKSDITVETNTNSLWAYYGFRLLLSRMILNKSDINVETNTNSLWASCVFS